MFVSRIVKAGSDLAVCVVNLLDCYSEEQIDVFHKILDCVSNTAAAEMSTAYKVGFKDSVALMIEVQI